jgi:hypothetical protein
VKTFICTYNHLWGRTDGRPRPTNTGQRSGSGFHGKVPFREDEIVSRDPDRRLDVRAIPYHSGVPVTAHSQVSSSFIGNSALRECRDHSYTFGSDLFSFVHSCHRRHNPHRRPASPKCRSTGCPRWPGNNSAGPYADETSYVSPQIIDRRSLASVFADYGHMSYATQGVLNRLDTLVSPGRVGLYYCMSP